MRKKALFKLINRALHRKQEYPLSPHSSEADLANSFSTFFKEKIQSIPNYLDSQISNNDVSAWHDQPCFNALFPEFKSLTEQEVKKVILNSPNKYCKLDPIPTSILREYIDEILPLLTKIINLSLQLGDMQKP